MSLLSGETRILGVLFRIRRERHPVGKNRHLLTFDSGSTGRDALQVSHEGMIISQDLIRGEKENAFRLIRQFFLCSNPFHLLPFQAFSRIAERRSRLCAVSRRSLRAYREQFALLLQMVISASMMLVVVRMPTRFSSVSVTQSPYSFLSWISWAASVSFESGRTVKG